MVSLEWLALRLASWPEASFVPALPVERVLLDLTELTPPPLLCIWFSDLEQLV